MEKELIKERPEDFRDYIVPRDVRLETPSPSPDSSLVENDGSNGPESSIPVTEEVIERKAEFGTVDYPLMTDIEERYELPDGMLELCLAVERQVQADPLQSNAVELDRALKREWFNISSKPGSSAAAVEDFLAAVTEGARLALPFIVNAFDANGNCALHYAVSHGNLAVVSRLVQCDSCDLNTFNRAGYTPVMLAALVDSSEQQDLSPLVRLFKKADLDMQSKKEGQTALMLACGHGRRDTVRLLLMNGCEIDAQDEEGSTALMCAAEHGHTDIVKLIIEEPNCDCSIEDNDGSTALSIAMEAGHRDIGVLLYAKMNFEE